MLAHQLDLFGGAPKPPKKIKVDDNVPAEEFSPVAEPAIAREAEPAAIINEQAEEITSEHITGMEAYEPVSHFLDEAVVSNDIEWSPEEDEEVHYREDGAFHSESITAINVDDEVLVHAHDAGYDEQEASFGNEPVFGEAAVTVHEEMLTTINANQESAGMDEAGEPVKVVGAIDATPAIVSKNKREEKDDGLNIPPDEELFKRQYYSMRETSAMFGVNQSLLRFWENEFDILQPKKNKKGDRYFRPVDVKNLVLIYNLLRVRKFTLEGAKEHLNKNKKAADTFELAGKLQKIKSFLLELKAGL